MNNYVTVPSAVNLFVAAVCWLVCLFFLLFGRTALIGGVKEREREVQVSDMLLLPSKGKISMAQIIMLPAD